MYQNKDMEKFYLIYILWIKQVIFIYFYKLHHLLPSDRDPRPPGNPFTAKRDYSRF